MSFEKNQNINFSAQEPEKKKHKIVIASVDIEQQARDVAEEKMLSSKKELKGFRGFFNKIWKHNLAHEYYRQKEIAKAKREIKESGNFYVGEKGDLTDHENAMSAIVERFAAEYEGETMLRKGEEKKTLEAKQPEEVGLKNNIQNLIKRFAGGTLSEEQFKLEKNNLFDKDFVDSGDEKSSKKNALLYVDNLLEIAKQVKESVIHGRGLDALDEDFEIVVGRARAGVETEAQYNAVDRITEKIQKSFVGKFLNEATVASAVAIAYGTIAKGTMHAAHRGAKLVGPLGMGLSAGIGGAVAGVRENKRIKEERAQHAREMAKGKQIENGSKRREEMEKFRYETKNASELAGNLRGVLEDLKNQPNEGKLYAVLEQLNEISSRVSFSEQEKIDLIGFSDSKDVEKERTNMYIAAAEAKVYLKKNIHADWATFYNNEQQLNEYLQHNKEVKIQKDFLGEKTAKDEAFNKMKRKQVAWAVTKGLGVGLGVGMAAQEIGAYMGNGKEGAFSGVGMDKQEHQYTALGWLRRYFSGELPPGEISSHGAIMGTKDFIKGHENLFSNIRRGVWADNDTPKFDKNELKLWWGGHDGSGIDKHGNFVFNVKHMTHDGSFHGSKHWDPQELMKVGKMKLLLSLSGDTQNQVIEIPIDANGNAIIDPNSKIGKIAFSSVHGHAKFLGKFAEVAVMGEKTNGIEHVNILATHIGKGIENVRTVVSNNPVGYDVEAPFVIPVTGRRPMEEVRNGERMQVQSRVQLMNDKNVVKQTDETVKDWEMEVEPRKYEEISDSEYIPVQETQIIQQDVISQKEAQEKIAKEKQELLRRLLNAKQKAGHKIIDAEIDHPVRAAAWHTIHKLEQSPDLKYENLNAPTAQEGDRKFNELVRKLWNELTVHGAVKKNGNGGWEIIEKSDLDGESCLKLLELAGITVDRSRINFVENGETADSGIIMDTSNSHGVSAQESGRKLVLDHHHPELSDRTTSATKFLYEALVGMGLLERKPYLEKYVEFVTRDDNKNFTDAEYKKIFKDYHRNLYGINRKLSLDQILELFEGGQDPMAPLPETYLKSQKYLNPATKKEETLAQLSENMFKKIMTTKREIKRMEKQGFVVDTGKQNYGKILIDVKTLKSDGKYQPRISGDAGGPIAAFARDFDTYISWSPNENSLAVFTKKKMSGDFLSQGRNTRGNMWTKNERDAEPLKITLKEILSKLSGKPFEIEGKLKEVIESVEKKNVEQIERNIKEKEKHEKMSGSLKDMTKLFSDFELSYDAIKEEAKKLNVSTLELAESFIQEKSELSSQYKVKSNKLDDREKEKLALMIILENEKEKVKEKIKNEGENDVLKITLRELEADLFEIEIRGIIK